MGGDRRGRRRLSGPLLDQDARRAWRRGRCVHGIHRPQVSENDMRLLGFAFGSERDWFRLRLRSRACEQSRAGDPLGACGEDACAPCAGGDASASGAGARRGSQLAARIVNELKDKAGAIAVGGPAGASLAAISQPGSASADAVSALQNLGFKPAVAASAVAHAQAELGEDAGLNELVRTALKRAAG